MSHIRPIAVVSSTLADSDAGLSDAANAAIVSAQPEVLLRGLFLFDGCRITNWTMRQLKAGPKRYEYPRYMFSNESPDIIGICTAALDQLDISWTLARPNLVSVARRQNVASLDTFIGPKS